VAAGKGIEQAMDLFERDGILVIIRGLDIPPNITRGKSRPFVTLLRRAGLSPGEYTSIGAVL
jgi:hypothetical protein